MPGGRPARPGARAHPELEEIAAWFRQALTEAGYGSVNAFVQRHPFDKNLVYGFANGNRFLALDSCRALAVALGRGPDEVDPLWWRAKQAIERQSAAGRDRGSPAVDSWDRLPWPPAALQDILEAQAQAVDLLPYQLLGVEPPPVSAVYVRQRARTQPVTAKADRKEARADGADRERADTGGEKPIPITEALDRHEHLVITGEPGAGKSTFGQYLTLQLSRLWLRQWNGEKPPVSEPVVPLRIPARTLVGARSWTAGLASAVQSALGLRLVSEPQAAQFERRPFGIRWLVIVDGLDEIVDRSARNEVIQALAARCRPGGDYRIVVTTRQLPDTEFGPLRTQHVETYSVELFGRDELRTFAEKWFGAQGAERPEHDAARFLHQTADGRLRELVRNPLLATIAAITYTRYPDRPLPSGRLDLYERFLDHLLDDDTSGRHTVAELRRVYAGRPARLRFAEWIYDRRRMLLRHLGAVRLDSERPLIEAALEWITEHAPAAERPPAGWEDDVRAVLVGSGLLLYEGDRLRFPHHSFAEFLAAEEHATRVGPEFTGLGEWIAKGLRPAEREFVLFLFARWCREPSHDVTRVIEPLLLGDPQRALLAGRLLAETGGAPEIRRRVRDRLFALALFHTIREELGTDLDPLGMFPLAPVEVDAIVEVLAGFVDDPAVIERLTGLAAEPRLPEPLRIAALRALGRVSDPGQALERLEALAPALRGMDLLEAARAAIALEPSGRLSRILLERLCGEPGVQPIDRVQAAAELFELGGAGTAVRVAREAVLGGRLDAESLRSALQTWLTGLPEGDERTAAIAGLLTTPLSARQRAVVAECLARIGRLDEAGDLAVTVLTELSELGNQVQPLLASCLRPGDRRLPEAVALIRRYGDPGSRAHAIRGLADAGCEAETIDLAREAIADLGADAYAVGLAAGAWLAAKGGTGLDEVLAAIRGRGTGRTRWIGNLVEVLADAGFPEAAIGIARDSLPTLMQNNWEAAECFETWLAAGGPEEAGRITAALDRLSGMPVQARAQVAYAFAVRGHLDEADRMTSGLIDLPVLHYTEVLAIARTIVLVHGEPGADLVVKALTDRDGGTGERMGVADHLAAAGHVNAAQRIWSLVLTRRHAPLHWLLLAAGRLSETGGAALAVATLAAHNDPVVQDRRSLIEVIGRMSRVRAGQL
ncbi:hypothetical protein KZ829_16905 [Actinoplanes hulinensis]|uniref:NACHT domain-containing protein n=1 Tax=Actinoplanes hulinensis TaxID=1144547 RepID=A0ABS7B315_9ACTN|nr:hypothetical protein [Actinoplanes hulinensis]MBW6435419.1 hypothetical protein [Actinoplanes hulinensis]